MSSNAHRDRGQVTPLLAALLVVGLVLAFAVVRLGSAAADRARAQAAADASALAGVTAGEAAARDLARRNGAEVESYTVQGGAVQVVVSVGAATATARAEPDRARGARGPARPGGP